MKEKILWIATIAILATVLGGLYGRWVAAESRERVAKIEAEKNQRIAELNAALQILEDAAEEMRARVDTFETVRIRHVDRATGFLGQAEETAEAIAEHLEARGDTAGARMFSTYVEERDSAQVSTVAALLAEQDRSLAALEGWAIADQQRDLEIDKRLAIEAANAGLHDEISRLQSKLSPAFFTRILRTGRDVAIGVAACYLLCGR